MPKGIKGSGPQSCSVEGCDRPYAARGYCHLCYGRNRPPGGYPPLPKLTPIELFYTHVELGHGVTCDRWTAHKSNWGYGNFGGGGVGGSGVAHRWIYEQLVGPIPVGLDLGHVCHDRDPLCPGNILCPHRLCVTLDHLKPMTRSQNMRDGKPSGRTNRCKNGHEFTEANTWLSKEGHRHCKRCNADNQSALQKARRAAGWRRRGNVWYPPKEESA